jgi:hypothetical protein
MVYCTSDAIIRQLLGIQKNNSMEIMTERKTGRKECQYDKNYPPLNIVGYFPLIAGF